MDAGSRHARRNAGRHYSAPGSAGGRALPAAFFATSSSTDTHCFGQRWKHDAMAFDLEAGCAPLPYGDNQTPAPWWPWAVTGSELEHKIRDPASCDRIGYSMRPQSQTPAFIARFVGFLVYCMVLAVLVPCLTRMGIDLIPASSDPETKRKSGMNGVASVWAEVLVTTGVVFLLAHGLMGYVRTVRERTHLTNDYVTHQYSSCPREDGAGEADERHARLLLSQDRDDGLRYRSRQGPASGGYIVGLPRTVHIQIPTTSPLALIQANAFAY